MADCSKGKLLSFWNMQASHIIRLISVREDSMGMDEISQYYGIIFSLTVIFLNPIQWTSLWHVHQKHWNIWACHSFWRPLCSSGVARGSQFVGTWLHSNLYIVHYKGFACAEIWHTCIQSATASLHLLLYPEMLEIPSLCVSRKICAETHWNPDLLCLTVRMVPSGRS